MKLSSTLAFALLQASSLPNPRSSSLQWMRSVVTDGAGESCATLDRFVFGHATPSLSDLRLLSPIGEIPHTITLSESGDPLPEAASIVQLESRPTGTTLLLKMPARPYTEVNLDLHQQDFVLQAAVAGTNDPSGKASTPLGTSTLFDLTSKHLSRNTVLTLQESDFRYLRVELSGDHLLAANIRGADVLPSREAQTLYTPVASSSSVRQRGSETVVSFRVSAHVPVERVSVELSPSSDKNFSRKVRVIGQSVSPDASTEIIEGEIAQVRLGSIQSRQMAFPAVMGVNLQQSADVEVAIENGGDTPLPVSSVSLEMRQRSICFDAPASPLNLFYGGSSGPATRVARSMREMAFQAPRVATLGPETRNPAFHAPEPDRSFSMSHSNFFWFLLLSGLGLGGVLALHTLRQR